MHQHITALVTAADAVRAATNYISATGDEPACAAFVEALDTLEATTEALRHAAPMPSIRALWERRVTVEQIFMPAAYFDAEYSGEALAELVEELDEMGTTGEPREVTTQVCTLIRRGRFEGLIGRVSMHRDENSRWTGVIAAESLDAFVSRAAEWGSAVLARAQAGVTELQQKAA